jgi:hypothetical protein
VFRIQPPGAMWCGRLSYDARHDSRSWCRRGRQRHNLLWSNLSLFSCHFRTHLIYLFFKGMFPSKINQPANNQDFNQQSHNSKTDRKSSPGSIGICTVESRPGSPIPATTSPPRCPYGNKGAIRARSSGKRCSVQGCAGIEREPVTWQESGRPKLIIPRSTASRSRDSRTRCDPGGGRAGRLPRKGCG